jgi:tRNA-Thr(GGU) m(6)t(6)A37 methyltransferase TsaA
MSECFQIYSIGVIRNDSDGLRIEIKQNYRDAMEGLEGFSHIVVLYWFHKNDTPENRTLLKVHPRADTKNPLTGVFATHSPKRPNLIGLSICHIQSIVGTTIYIDKIDAFDGSPVIDIKCYIPSSRPNLGIRLPDWV